VRLSFIQATVELKIFAKYIQLQLIVVETFKLDGLKDILEFVSAHLDAYLTLWLLLIFLMINHSSHIF
jgi:hypothetical protein